MPRIAYRSGDLPVGHQQRIYDQRPVERLHGLHREDSIIQRPGDNYVATDLKIGRKWCDSNGRSAVFAFDDEAVVVGEDCRDISSHERALAVLESFRISRAQHVGADSSRSEAASDGKNQ